MKKVFLTLVAATIIFSCKKKDEVVPEDPKSKAIAGYFNMDGSASDSTGKLGIVTNDVTFSAKTAIFNGTSSFMRIPAEGTFAVPDQLSFSLFFKAVYNDATKQPRLLQMNDEKGNAVEIYIQNSRLHFSNWNQSLDKEVSKIMTPTSPDLKKWHKVVATIDFERNEMSLYLNDQLVKTVTNVTLTRPENATLILGYHQHPGDQPKDFYQGEMDNFKIHPGIIEQSVLSTIVR
ncbi:MAG: hypothetical protein AVDCRST_MAG56-4998 [uncultured Cytophagales bacterium]|uniref:LamG-like jellyroll fold domain-containing protein n=1 Tax=uncultured Cytophagales bacterium TaxID=158755 RepID=A0A6J4K332_9SPHI|nr:MAG: hypothetical protein AVDCRST_MAG56-4998 [uncultured Cytophagales bacterium]